MWKWKLPFLKDKGLSNGLIMGESCSGKTTLLYTLCGMRNFATIPTIGFNIEEITARDGSGWNFTLWDVGGGCGHLRPFFKHYLAEKDFCIFLHDISSEYLAQESLAAFQDVLEDCASAGCRQVWVVFTKQDLVSSEGSSEGGSEGGSESGERLLEEKLEAVVAKYQDLAAPFTKDQVQVRVLPLPGFSALSQAQADELLSEICRGLQQEKEAKEAAKKEAKKAKRTKPGAAAGVDGQDKSKSAADVAATSTALSEEDLRLAAEQAIAGLRQQPAEAFWTDFLAGRLASWDHAAHLRAGLGVILQGYLRPRGLFAWTDDFISHLDRLREARPDLFRNTAHRTMTLFWLHRIHRALRSYMVSTAAAAHSSPDASRLELPQLDDFPQVLRADPHLMDKNLWRQFYSQGLMFSQQAKAEWCLPDLAMLPDTVPSAVSAVPVERVPSESKEASNLAGGDELRLPRFAFAVVKKAIASGARRGGVVKRALGVLQQVTMRKRAAAAAAAAKNTSLPPPPPPPPPYSETQAYFWIQYVHACLSALDRGGLPYQGSQGSQGSLQDLSFAALQAMFALRGDEWRQFYKAERWEDVGSRSQMVLPDRRPLPNVFAAPSAQSLDRAKSMMVQQASQTVGSFGKGVAPAMMEDATEEELAFLADLVADEAERLPKEGWEEKETTLAVLSGDDDDNDDNDDRTLVDNKTEEGRSTTASRAELLLFIFRGLTAANVRTHADLSAASIRVAGALQSGSHQVTGVTQALFWVRLVLGALMMEKQQQQQQQQQQQKKTKKPKPGPELPQRAAPPSFGEFVRQHPELALDYLQWIYYSPEVWESAAARETFVMPDRKAMSSAL